MNFFRTEVSMLYKQFLVFIGNNQVLAVDMTGHRQGRHLLGIEKSFIPSQFYPSLPFFKILIHTNEKAC